MAVSANGRDWHEKSTHRNFDIKGLRITFEEDQVAPHEEGAQEIIVPYSVLRPIANPSGILADFFK
jgi:hypothetical protein